VFNLSLFDSKQVGELSPVFFLLGIEGKGHLWKETIQSNDYSRGCLHFSKMKQCITFIHMLAEFVFERQALPAMSSLEFVGTV